MPGFWTVIYLYEIFTYYLPLNFGITFAQTLCTLFVGLGQHPNSRLTPIGKQWKTTWGNKIQMAMQIVARPAFGKVVQVEGVRICSVLPRLYIAGALLKGLKGKEAR